MAHKVHQKLLANWLKKGMSCKLSDTCELHGNDDEELSPCSHWDHCERKAVIWIYDSEPSWVYGFCNTCYNWCFPATDRWYRVVKISEEFNGRL
jgi:hypothetical protein